MLETDYRSGEGNTNNKSVKTFSSNHLSVNFLKPSHHRFFSNPTCLCVHFFSPKTIRSWIVVSIAKEIFATHECFTFRIFSSLPSLSHTHTLNLSHTNISNIKSFSYFSEVTFLLQNKFGYIMEKKCRFLNFYSIFSMF